MNKSLLWICCLGLSLSLSACLKTRAQLKDDSDDSSNTASRPTPVQVKDVQVNSYAVDELKAEVIKLTGRVDELERAQQEALSKAKPDEYKKLEQRVTELEQAQMNALDAIKKMQASTPAPDATELYESARSKMKIGDYDSAIDLLTNYLKNPKGQFAEGATFARGEAYYFAKQYKKAIIDFSKFPEKYSTSSHMPAALLKIGQSFDALGMKDDAKGFYQELADKFPKSPEAKKARAKLR